MDKNMKLIIQIPCYNESQTLSATFAALPRTVSGFNTVEWLVVDDGSEDDTAEIAKSLGADYVVRHTRNKGLAKAFMTGLEACLRHGADVIVNLDADNQYDASYINVLVKPILEGHADLVIGERPIDDIEDFSPLKKYLQRVGSRVGQFFSDTSIPDAPSGFRALSREAALRTNVFNNYTYTLETIIQAGHNRLALCSVPVKVNRALRPSRLVKSSFSYIRKSVTTIIRIFVLYKPFRFLLGLAAVFALPGILLGLRFLYFYCSDGGDGHVQSLILAGLLITLSGIITCIAFVADISAANRKQLEELLYMARGDHARKDSE
jgi:glycosyltransferase involved in cell wall biosynthesis